MASLTPEELQKYAQEYFPLARSLAAKRLRELPPGAQELDDLIGVASVALVSSLQRFDPSRGIAVSYWISFRVKKAFLDYSRSRDPLSQDRRELVGVVTEVEQWLERVLQRNPTPVEIAGILECEEQEVLEIQKKGRLKTISVEEEGVAVLVERRQFAQESRDPVHQHMELHQKAQHLEECVAALTDQEQTALRMRFEDRTLAEIARTLQLSVATADRRVQEAVSKVSDCMQKKGWS